MRKLIDLTGKKFGRLLVLQFSKKQKKDYYWECKCDCGKLKIVNGRCLRSGNIKSCGCYKNELFCNMATTHKSSRTKLYNIYKYMLGRCYNKNNDRYKNYGGRGIKVCDEWKNDFMNFHDWAYENGYKEEILPNGRNKWTIDRIDVNGNYEPSNCRWITIQEQALNKTNTVKLSYKGETLSRKEWANKLGINDLTITWRLKNGWDIEKVFSNKDYREKNNK